MISNKYINNLKGGIKIGEGGYGCVFHPEINCKGKETKNKKYVSKIQMNDYSSKNEIHIGSYLTKSLKNKDKIFLTNNFAPVISSCKIDIKNINNDLIKDCDILKKYKMENNFVISKIRYINMQDFDTFIIKEINNRELLSFIINSYEHLLNSINKLIELNIIHFDLKGPNIVFDKSIDLPILIDFGLSINMDNLILSNLYNYFYVYAPQYYIWPLEVHYMNLLIHVTASPTNEQLFNLARDFTLKHRALISFSDNFKSKYIELCYKILLSYNTLSLEGKKNKILKAWKSWDNYSLSVIYIKIIYYLNKNTGNKIVNNKLVQSLIELFLINIHPDFTKRLSIKDTLDKFNKIINMEESIELINELRKNITKNKKAMGKEIQLESKREEVLSLQIKR